MSKRTQKEELNKKRVKELMLKRSIDRQLRYRHVIVCHRPSPIR